uniref:DUF3024 domain-containing protein n=1 Tax=Saccharospirillum impatiens TaxID=169438 RepID=UPI001FDFA8BA
DRALSDWLRISLTESMLPNPRFMRNNFNSLLVDWYVGVPTQRIHMVFSEFEAKKIERAASEFLGDRRPPVEIRPQLDLDVRVSGQSVQIVEIRPHFREPSTNIESPVAKATYVKKSPCWKIYWMRSDLKWHSYTPEPESRSIEEFFAIVNADENGCFFG